MIKSVSLCSGISGLDMAVNEYYDCETLWFCDNDVHCQLVLNEHYPNVPIVPDIREIDDGFGEVDILHGGYPCQPFSTAGHKRIEQDPRYLWPEFARAIGVLQPKIVIVENVRGHLKRGFDRTLRDFASMGYDVQWGIVGAFHAGAPHRRARLFAIAHSSSAGAGWHSRAVSKKEKPSGRKTKNNSYPFKPVGEIITDSNRKRFDRRKARAREGRRERFERSSEITADAYRERQQRDTTTLRGMVRSILTKNMDKEIFGKYEAAVRRWEHLTGTPAPYPADGNGRLDPDFVEWMMGFPIGYTDGLAFTNRIKVLGNAVVPHQAYLALDVLNNME